MTTNAAARPQRHDQAGIRRRNLALVASLIRSHGEISRAQLAAETGLNKVTVYSLVGDLLGAGLVEEGRTERRPGAGRPTSLLRISERSLVGIAAEINIDHITVSACSLLGTQIITKTVAVEGVRQPQEKIVAAFCDALVSTHQQARADGYRIVGMLVGIPGVISSTSSKIVHAPYLNLCDVPLVDMIRERLDDETASVRLDRLSNLAAYAERASVDPPRESVGLIYGNFGVGGAAIVGGDVLRGATGYGGDFGHIQMDPDGPVCVCGRRGCLQTFTGVAALLAEIETLDVAATVAAQPSIEDKVREVVRLAATDEGAPICDVLKRQSRWLARGAAILVQVLSPQALVLGGQFTHLAPLFLDAYTEELSSLVAPDVLATTETVVSTLATRAPLQGAIDRICDAVLADPDHILNRS